MNNTSNVQLCTGCEFMKWGTWGGQLEFRDGGRHPQQVTADVNFAWYVVGNITTKTQLDDFATWLALGPSATYTGSAIGNVANNIDGTGWKTYVATGNLAMNWNFADRVGDLTISKFDTTVVPGGLSFSGSMCAPGVSCGENAGVPSGNHFGGRLSVVQSASLPNSLSDLAGSAARSFVNNGNTVAAGVIGNFKVQNDVYGATGIFGGKRP